MRTSDVSAIGKQTRTWERAVRTRDPTSATCRRSGADAVARWSQRGGGAMPGEQKPGGTPRWDPFDLWRLLLPSAEQVARPLAMQAEMLSMLGGRTALQGLLEEVRAQLVGRRLTFGSGADALTLTLDDVAAHADPLLLAVGQLGEVTLTATQVQWRDFEFVAARATARNTHTRPGARPLLIAAPVDLVVTVSDAQLSRLVARTVVPGRTADHRGRAGSGTPPETSNLGMAGGRTLDRGPPRHVPTPPARHLAQGLADPADPPARAFRPATRRRPPRHPARGGVGVARRSRPVERMAAGLPGRTVVHQLPVASGALGRRSARTGCVQDST